MGGGKDSPAYYVTIQKEKTVKAFYWMINSSKVYSMMDTSMKSNKLVMNCDKSPAVEVTDEVRAFLQTTVTALKPVLPNLTMPEAPMEFYEVMQDLANKDIIRKDTLTEAMMKRLEEIKKKKEKTQSPRRSSRELKQKNPKAVEKWITNPQPCTSFSQPIENGIAGNSSQLMGTHHNIFTNSPR